MIDFNEIEKSEDFNVALLNMDTSLIESNGFIGNAFVYDEEIYVNTYTGKGYDIVVSKMQSFINWNSGKIRLAGFEREDNKQLIAAIILDGIRRYNPEFKIKLSTFLYVHVKNRLISRIKEETKQSSNATYNAPRFKYICQCKHFFIASKIEAINACCKNCKRTIDDTWVYQPVRIETISFDGLESNNKNGADKSFHYTEKKSHIVDFFGKIDLSEDIDRILDFSSVISEADETTRKIAELMYKDDYSITDAANEVGLTCWAASLRLKKLKNNKNIRDFFLNI